MTTKDFKTIFLAGGCFWGVEAYFRQLKGIIDTGVGYAQGHTEEPSYEQVCTGKTGHTETVMLIYNPLAISLEEILDHFFRIINPFTINKQGNDIGSQYRSGIYYDDDHNLPIILNFVNKLQKQHEQKIVVEIEALQNFWRAEEYHQRYLEHKPNAYCHVDLGLAKDHETKKGTLN